MIAVIGVLACFFVVGFVLIRQEMKARDCAAFRVAMGVPDDDDIIKSRVEHQAGQEDEYTVWDQAYAEWIEEERGQPLAHSGS